LQRRKLPHAKYLSPYWPVLHIIICRQQIFILTHLYGLQTGFAAIATSSALEIIVLPNQLDTDPIQDETHQVRATRSGGRVQASALAATISATISSNKIIFKII